MINSEPFLDNPNVFLHLKALPGIDSLTSAAIDPLFTSLQNAIEAIILTMHNEDFSRYFIL